eukprot:6206672-Pleurochrysis_carterae.AAC.2
MSACHPCTWQWFCACAATWVHTRRCKRTRLCKHACVRVFVGEKACACASVFACACACACACPCACACACVSVPVPVRPCVRASA